MSLVDLAENNKDIEYLLAFDDDDTESINYFVEHTLPALKTKSISCQAISFKPMGYTRLNEYVNGLAAKSSGRWLMFWNDDAVMITACWDRHIKAHDGKFCTLRMPTHNQHPYAIFPIVPRSWFEFFGYLSAHQISDAWISQISYMMGIMQNINVEVLHDRFDLTGNNKDHTFVKRVMFEGNPDDTRDFNHLSWRQKRLNDAKKLAIHLKNQGIPTTWFDNVIAGRQDPWETMLDEEHDPNKQMSQIPHRPGQELRL